MLERSFVSMGLYGGPHNICMDTYRFIMNISRFRQRQCVLTVGNVSMAEDADSEVDGSLGQGARCFLTGQ